MFIKQVSVFMENKVGKLREITKVLREGNIDIRAFNITDTTEFGILRLIVRDAEKAAQLIREAGMTAQITDVLVAAVEDRTGSFDEIIDILSTNGLDIQYSYSFVGEKVERGQIVIKTSDMKKALECLKSGGARVLGEKDI